MKHFFIFISLSIHLYVGTTSCCILHVLFVTFYPIVSIKLFDVKVLKVTLMKKVLKVLTKKQIFDNIRVSKETVVKFNTKGD